MEEKVIRWGLLGAGAILKRWMKGARQVEGMEIAAVASRTRRTAERAAEEFQIPQAVSYEELLGMDDIDVVYIPVPHPAHKELALAAMRAGKAVLVEKPAGINAAEFEEMIACAKEQQVFLMEAVWTKFFPLLGRLESYYGESGIGEVRMICSNFSYRTEDPSSRVLDLQKAGGGLLDTGVYNLHFAQKILKKNPVRLTGLASMDTDELHLKLDEQAVYLAQYDAGELAMMSSAVRTTMQDTAYIYGTKGHIVVPVFWKPTRAHVVIGDQAMDLEEPVPQKLAGVEDEGYQYEVAHVNDCLRRGLVESPVVPWEDSLAVLRQCDQLRKEWGLVYPQELQ